MSVCCKCWRYPENQSLSSYSPEVILKARKVSGFRMALLELLFHRQFPKVSALLSQNALNRHGKENAQKSIPSLFRPESATFQSGTMWKRRACWGVEGFAERLRHLVTETQQIREMPKGQRLVARPSLEKLFSQRSRGKTSRDRLIAETVAAHGYSQIEVASCLRLHHSTISRILTIMI